MCNMCRCFPVPADEHRPGRWDEVAQQSGQATGDDRREAAARRGDAEHYEVRDPPGGQGAQGDGGTEAGEADRLESAPVAYPVSPRPDRRRRHDVRDDQRRHQFPAECRA